MEIKNRWDGNVIHARTNLNGANLSDADLRRADLRRADLRRANLNGADLNDADLSDADLRRANLSGANLSGANLSGADLNDADLSGANLNGADLSDADLSDADLRRANLSGANLSGANLSGANLSDAKNIPPVTPMPELKAEILKRVNADPSAINMCDWHSCQTTHCLAGWATTLHPQGPLLESLIGVRAAAGLIFHASIGVIPNFYTNNDQAIEWLKS